MLLRQFPHPRRPLRRFRAVHLLFKLLLALSEAVELGQDRFVDFRNIHAGFVSRVTCTFSRPSLLAAPRWMRPEPVHRTKARRRECDCNRGVKNS